MKDRVKEIIICDQFINSDDTNYKNQNQEATKVVVSQRTWRWMLFHGAGGSKIGEAEQYK